VLALLVLGARCSSCPGRRVGHRLTKCSGRFTLWDTAADDACMLPCLATAALAGAASTSSVMAGSVQQQLHQAQPDSQRSTMSKSIAPVLLLDSGASAVLQDCALRVPRSTKAAVAVRGSSLTWKGGCLEGGRPGLSVSDRATVSLQDVVIRGAMLGVSCKAARVALSRCTILPCTRAEGSAYSRVASRGYAGLMCEDSTVMLQGCTLYTDRGLITVRAWLQPRCQSQPTILPSTPVAEPHRCTSADCAWRHSCHRTPGTPCQRGSHILTLLLMPCWRAATSGRRHQASTDQWSSATPTSMT
jgi:hypothetical protein